MARPPSDARDRILDAAEDLVLREGSSRLTLDAVAAEAKVSKGGLLYHFPSKDDLIRAMVERLIALFDRAMTSLVSADPEPVGRVTRAFLSQMRLAESDPTLARADRVSAALVAASAANPSLLEPLRECYRGLQVALERDGIDPVSANIVRLAADALWMGGLFGIPGPNTALREQVFERLSALTRVPYQADVAALPAKKTTAKKTSNAKPAASNKRVTYASSNKSAKKRGR